MGSIVDRSLENLGTSDRAIVTMRRLLLEAIEELKENKTPRGCDPSTHRSVRPYDAFVKAGDDWRAIFDPQIIAKW